MAAKTIQQALVVLYNLYFYDLQSNKIWNVNTSLNVVYSILHESVALSSGVCVDHSEKRLKKNNFGFVSTVVYGVAMCNKLYQSTENIALNHFCTLLQTVHLSKIPSVTDIRQYK